ncbi:helix-turn-helix domain-containing protein [Arachidicoccus sp.]|uniref:helix-turn-helix domain-containing protein n=1 Tax=Arachidicoccus sp. TaxID=1872624 RepID=UPI003D19B6F6
MTDAEYLELLRQERGLTQQEMAIKLGLTRQSAYTYYMQQGNFKKRATINNFKRKLKIKLWHDEKEVVKKEELINVLYERVVYLEHLITQKNVKEIRESIENKRKIKEIKVNN